MIREQGPKPALQVVTPGARVAFMPGRRSLGMSTTMGTMFAENTQFRTATSQIRGGIAFFFAFSSDLLLLLLFCHRSIYFLHVFHFIIAGLGSLAGFASTCGRRV